MKSTYDVVVIGGGPAGMAAAIQAKEAGAPDVLIIERNEELGGILLQCIHNGFGSVLFKEDLPGPSYAQRFIDRVWELGIESLPDTMVMDITPDRKVYYSSREGYGFLNARAIVLAMGCRERTRSQIRTPGFHPAGVFTAGAVQRLVNIDGYMPGREFVILGSGDIGMIMARRLTLEGAKVKRVVELAPHLTGLRRNYVQCLEDFGIPLQLSTTVKRILGSRRVEGVEICKVTEKFELIPGTEETIDCDTLLLSVGLIPENELSRRMGVELDPLTSGPVVNERMETNLSGVFAAGNVVHIYDLVDYVSQAGYTAGKSAAQFASGERAKVTDRIRVLPGEGVRTVVPQFLDKHDLERDDVLLQLRVNRLYEEKVWLEVSGGGGFSSRTPEHFARPSEMITVKLKRDKLSELSKANPESITIGVRPDRGEKV